MHLQQTKVESRATGGPQYFFHNLPAGIKDFLRHKGACPVLLQTPYGVTTSHFMAVGKDHKLDARKRPVAGKVGHDRIQQAQGTESIGEAIRKWYGIPAKRDFERIDLEGEIHPAGHFIIAPVRVFLREGKRGCEIKQTSSPLSFHEHFQSPVWKQQIAHAFRQQHDAAWIYQQINLLLQEHADPKNRNIHEADLLRSSGALAKLGLQLGPYSVRHYDCASTFQFLNFIPYSCPVEIKKQSSGFSYQMKKYNPLPRAVVLCLKHDLANVPKHIDVVELSFMAKYLANL